MAIITIIVLIDNSELFSSVIKNQLNSYDIIHLVGYSMGGLIARLAASNEYNKKLHTIITIATPNRGALGNAELEYLGQIALKGTHLITSLCVRSPGIMNLTNAYDIMLSRRKKIRNSIRNGKPTL